ncbi:peritrophin-44-like [Panulirus ornatus]|uniref:peritrophin-44-like n=1 Tax=Panulirus ornatus TaxID=150431 RepID=UPI003A85421D
MVSTTLILAMALFLILAGAEVGQASKIPRNTCTCPPTKVLQDVCMVPDPQDCQQFYYCVGGTQSPDPLHCPDGEMFDEVAGHCVEGSCSDSGSSCLYECSATTGFSKVADRYDCTVYSECTSGVQTSDLIPCPAGLPFFDGVKCQEKESKCCSCKPYCSSRDHMRSVIDMKDCKTHYFCAEDNVIPQHPGHCPSGNFDILSGKCSETAPCVTLCHNVVEADGCIDIFTCKKSGYFAKCKERCDSRYYHCTNADVGTVITPDECQPDQFFHPDTLTCQTCSKCPFDESSCSLS